MQKNELIVRWLGWVVVLSNIVSFCLGFLGFWNIRNLPTELYLILSNLSGVLAVFPRGIPLILSIRDGHVNFLAFVIPLWALVMMWCGDNSNTGCCRGRGIEVRATNNERRDMVSNIQTKNIGEVRDLGLIDYDAAYRIQKECVEGVIVGGAQTILLCEHPAVITLGRMSREANILDRKAIDRAGIRIIPIDRGGDVTLHAPGQLVVYPILNLANWRRDLHWYLHQLEQVAVDLLGSFGIVASRISGRTGVWVGGKKIASIGIGIRKWISFHGLAINVNTDVNLFALIKPCGLDAPMTTMAVLQGKPVEIKKVKENVFACFCQNFGLMVNDGYACA